MAVLSYTNYQADLYKTATVSDIAYSFLDENKFDSRIQPKFMELKLLYEDPNTKPEEFNKAWDDAYIEGYVPFSSELLKLEDVLLGQYKNKAYQECPEIGATFHLPAVSKEDPNLNLELVIFQKLNLALANYDDNAPNRRVNYGNGFHRPSLVCKEVCRAFILLAHLQNNDSEAWSVISLFNDEIEPIHVLKVALKNGGVERQKLQSIIEEQASNPNKIPYKKMTLDSQVPLSESEVPKLLQPEQCTDILQLTHSLDSLQKSEVPTAEKVITRSWGGFLKKEQPKQPKCPESTSNVTDWFKDKIFFYAQWDKSKGDKTVSLFPKEFLDKGSYPEQVIEVFNSDVPDEKLLFVLHLDCRIILRSIDNNECYQKHIKVSPEEQQINITTASSEEEKRKLEKNYKLANQTRSVQVYLQQLEPELKQLAAISNTKLFLADIPAP